MDILTLGLLVGFLVGIPSLVIIAFVFVRATARSAVKTVTRGASIEEALKTLGFKNFKVTDLNKDKLDDTGFSRLMYMLNQMKTPSAATGWATQLQQLIQATQKPQQPLTPGVNEGVQ
jgi:hypothetical protein